MGYSGLCASTKERQLTEWGSVDGWGSDKRVQKFNDACVAGDRSGLGWDGTWIHVTGPRTGLGRAGSRRTSRIENIICGALQLTVV